MTTLGYIPVSYLALLLLGCTHQPRHREHPALQHIISLKEQAHQFYENGNRDSALRIHHEILQIARQKNLKVHEAHAHIALSHLTEEYDPDKSIEHLYNALAIARSIGHNKLQGDIYLAIKESHKRQQNYEAALKALEIHYQLLDSLVMNDAIRELAVSKASADRKLERWIAGIVSIFLLIIGAVLIYYNRKLHYINRNLRKVNAVKDKLFAILGHDLRGPAGSLMSALANFGNGTFSETEQKELLHMLQRQSNILYNTLETLLQWANTQQRGLVTNPKLFDAAENIEKNILLLEGLSGQKKVTIAWDRKKPLQVWADPDHVDFIFRNLLSNAVKFSFPGGVIHLMTETDDTVIRFTVEDEGVGMPQEKIRLFETDDLSSSYGTGGEKGSGLGLQVVRKFITANNGHIHLSSQENKGTTVSFTLPKLPLHG